MNIGIGDAFYLAWELACVIRHNASDRLLDTYQAERRPVAADVVRQTSRAWNVVIGCFIRAARLRSCRGLRNDRVGLRDCCGTPAKLEGHRHTVHSGRTRRPSLAFEKGCHLSAIAPVPAGPTHLRNLHRRVRAGRDWHSRQSDRSHALAVMRAVSSRISQDPCRFRATIHSYGDIWTTAGVTAGIDLTLSLIEDDHGAALACIACCASPRGLHEAAGRTAPI
jgi:FAD binding domain